MTQLIEYLQKKVDKYEEKFKIMESTFSSLREPDREQRRYGQDSKETIESDSRMKTSSDMVSNHSEVSKVSSQKKAGLPLAGAYKSHQLSLIERLDREKRAKKSKKVKGK